MFSSNILDDKSQHCVPFILDQLTIHRERFEREGQIPPPFFVGLNGVQGVGKTTLVSGLSRTLSSPPHSLPVLVLSIDDLYLTHKEQEALAREQSRNPLVQHRGQPSTHDVHLGRKLFEELADRKTDIRVPSYDKSAFNGAGDRRPVSGWPIVNPAGTSTVEVVIFEGWCVGFRSLNGAELERKWKTAQAEYECEGEGYKGQLGRQQLESAVFINNGLRDYDVLTDRLGAFIHIDTEDLSYIYQWRLEQERALRASTGKGMSDDQVMGFVNGYYPSYELYTVVLRAGIFGNESGKQLRLVVDKNRRVKEVMQI